MKDGANLALAIQITATAFEEKLDKAGVPYILHCLTVMERAGKITQKDSEVMQIAVMHDLIEDTNWEPIHLKNLGFSNRVVTGVNLMTHRKGEAYEVYIERVGANPDTRIVKMCDLKHNSDITRMKGVTAKDIKRLEKYCKSYNYLKDLV